MNNWLIADLLTSTLVGLAFGFLTASIIRWFG